MSAHDARYAGMRVELSADGRLLAVRFSAEHDLVSWAIVNGGRARGCGVVWRYVDEQELGLDSDPEALLRRSLAAASLPDAVGLLTSRSLASYSDCRRRHGTIAARCIATVGLSNALRAGDAPEARTGTRHAQPFGTINLLCHVSHAMREEAMLEALALAAEARTAAVVDAAVSSRRSGDAATGTGTDCIVIAAPVCEAPPGAAASRGEETMLVRDVPSAGDAPIRFAGKHTVVGHLIGAVVMDAIADGIVRWKRECPEDYS